MAEISRLSRLLAGVERGVDLSTNTLVVLDIKVGGGSGTLLTQTILNNLINLQNGTDFSNGTNAHTHDGRYFTETELSAATGTSGSQRIGDENTYSNFTPSAATVKGALSGIDAALAATADEKVGVSSADTTPGYLDEKVSVDIGTNATNALESTIQSPGGDETFRIRFDASKVDHGALTGLGDDDHTIYTKADGTRAFTGNQSFGGFQATNLADPTTPQAAATKAYVDARDAGLKPKEAARVSTQANVNLANALEDGDVIDGITLDTGDRVLVRFQTAPEDNGIYVVQASGAAVRATDFDSLTPVDEINRAWVPVQEGSDAGKVFVQYGIVAVLGTDPINFTFYDPISSLIGGDMITKTGSTLSVDLLTNGGLKSSNPGNVGGQLQISLEASNPSLEINGSNELKAKLASGGAITSGASGLQVGVDDSTIEINANALRVKAAGINENHLAASVAGAGLTGGAGSALAVGAGDGITVNANDVAVNVAALVGSGIENDGSNNFRIAAAAYDQSTITGGGGSAAAVQHAPKIQETKVAGEAFAATTLFAVRYAKAADAGFVAGRMYKADNDATSVDNFWVIGLARPASLLAAGDPIIVVKNGLINVPSHGFTVGQPVWLDASGAVTGTAPSTASLAAIKVGMVADANNIDVQIGEPKVN